MSSNTDNRSYTGDGTELNRAQISLAKNGPVAASAKLFVGCLAGSLLTDTAKDPALLDYVADGTQRCEGFVTVGADNTGGALGAVQTRVIAQTGTLVDKNAGGANAITIADKFKPAYGCDNQTCSKLPADGPCIGMFSGMDRKTGLPVVLVDPVLARMISVLSPKTFRTIKNVAGHNGAGTCTATGAKVGDVVLGVNFAKVPSAAATTQAGLTAFESTITVADQIQQTGAADLHLEAFDVLLLSQS